MRGDALYNFLEAALQTYKNARFCTEKGWLLSIVPGGRWLLLFSWRGLLLAAIALRGDGWLSFDR